MFRPVERRLRWHRHRNAARLTLAALSLACAKDERRTAVEWAAPVLATDSAIGGAAPVLATAPHGNLSLAWVSAPNGGSDGRLYVRPDLGASTTSELRDPLGSLSIYGEVPPKIAYGADGTLYAAYLVTKVVPGHKWPQNALRFAVSSDGGAHWNAPTTVTGDSVFGSYDDHALHVAPNGAIYLSWLAEGQPNSSHAYLAHSSDGGKSWSKPAVIDGDPACPCCRTSLTSGPDGALYASWRKRFDAPGGEERDIVIARSTNGGESWSAPVRVHTDAWKVNMCPDAGPSVRVASDGIVHVAWWSGKEGEAGTRYAQSLDSGRTFTAPVPLGIAEFSRAAHIQLAVGGDRSQLIAAAWDDGTLAIQRIAVRLSHDGGKTFGAAELLSAPDGEAGYPVVSLNRDTVVVAWQQRSLAAVAQDSAARAAKLAKDSNDASAWINRVGTMQVISRRGIIARGAAP